MKRFLLIVGALAILGAGCVKATTPSAMSGAYRQPDYGFAFQYPAETMDAHERASAIQDFAYLGLPVKYFVTLRDTVRDMGATNLAAFYAAENLSTDAFIEALVASGAKREDVAQEAVKNGEIAMTKVTSPTESGETKTHYLFDHSGKTIIILVYLFEDEAFKPVLATFKKP